MLYVSIKNFIFVDANQPAPMSNEQFRFANFFNFVWIPPENIKTFLVISLAESVVTARSYKMTVLLYHFSSFTFAVPVYLQGLLDKDRDNKYGHSREAWPWDEKSLTRQNCAHSKHMFTCFCAPVKTRAKLPSRLLQSPIWSRLSINKFNSKSIELIHFSREFKTQHKG